LFTSVVTIHVLVCVVLILAVLLQSGKGGGLSSAFGTGGPSGGMAGQMFGGRGAATFLTKVTTVLATLYMLAVIGLNLVPDDIQRPSSIIQEEALRNQQASPAQGLPDVESGFPVIPDANSSQTDMPREEGSSP